MMHDRHLRAWRWGTQTRCCPIPSQPQALFGRPTSSSALRLVFDLQVAYFVDVSHQPVAPAHRADPLGCPGHDHVAGSQLDQGTQVRDGLGNFPDLLAQVTLLPELVVDAQPDRAALRVAYLGCWTDRTYRGGPVEALGHVPGPSGLLRLGLQVAAGRFDGHGVAQPAGRRG